MPALPILEVPSLARMFACCLEHAAVMNCVWFGRYIVAHSRFWLSKPVFNTHYSLVDSGSFWTFYRYWHNLSPIPLHLMSLLIFFALSGYAFFLAERVSDDWHLTQATPHTQLPGDPDPRFPASFGNSVWMSIVTAGTIGYGQYLCHTFLGRAIMTLVTFVGLVYIGLVVSAVTIALEPAQEVPPLQSPSLLPSQTKLSLPPFLPHSRCLHACRNAKCSTL